jgi:hypothetical protein
MFVLPPSYCAIFHSVFYGRTSAALIHTTELLQKQIKILADIPDPVKRGFQIVYCGHALAVSISAKIPETTHLERG